MSGMTTKKTQPTTDTITADDLTRLRDEEQNSWAKVAGALGLGSPGAARRTYSALVRPHQESVLAGRTTKGGNLTPLTLAGATLAAVREAIVGKTIVVQRRQGTEAIAVAKVTSVKGGAINLSDGAKARTVKAEAVLGTR